MPRRTIPSCSCGWLWSGTTAFGSSSIRLIIAPEPNNGRPVTPAASSNDLTSSKWTHCTSGMGGLSAKSVEPAAEVAAFGPVGRQRKRAVVRGARLVEAVEPAQEVCPCSVVGDVAVQPVDLVHGLEAAVGAV